MKFNLKESLIKYNLLKEGWMQDLEGKYEEDLLTFVNDMLTQAFPNENIDNNSMAEWIADSTKGFLRGKEMPLKEPHKTGIINAFQDVLKFIKESENAEEEVIKIKSKKPADALKYVQEEAKKREEEARIKAEKEAEEEARKKEEANISPEKELKQWLDRGLMKVIGRGPKGSFWVQPLKGEFFGVAQCVPLSSGGGSQNAGEFGIGCQRGETAGFGAVGFGRDKGVGETYSLLGKAENGYYTTLISTGYNTKKDEFAYHSLQYGNKNIGSEGWGKWSAEDFANAFVDFMTKNPYGIKMYKEGGNTTTNLAGETVSSSTSLPHRFASIKKHKDIFYRLLREHPNFLNYYDIAVRKELGEEEYATFKIKAKELYESDPQSFIRLLPTYLKTEKDVTLDILKNKIDFKDFIQRYGEESILKNIYDIIKIISYEEFSKLIKPHINFKSFLQSISSKELKELFRFISEKNNSAKNSLDWLNDFVKESPEDIMELLGDGAGPSAGFTKLLKFFKTPRLEKHKNYTIKDGVTTASYDVPDRDENGNLIDYEGRVIMASRTDDNNNQVTEVFDENGNVLNFNNDAEKVEYIKGRIHKVKETKEIQPSLNVLDPKRIRDFIRDNEEFYKKINGDNEYAQLSYLLQLLSNSNEKDRNKEVKKEKDILIKYYNEEREKGNTNTPGLLRYSEMLFPKRQRNMSNGKKGVKLYKLDKKDYNDNKSELFKYYATNANGNGKVKFSNTAEAMLQVMELSGFSEEEIKSQINEFANIAKKMDSKGEGGKFTTLLYYITNCLYDNGKTKEAIEIIENENIINKFIVEDSKNISSIDKWVKELTPVLDSNNKKYITNFLKSEKVKNLVYKDSSITSEQKWKDLINTLKVDDLSEASVRNYVKKVLEYNFK